MRSACGAGIDQQRLGLGHAGVGSGQAGLGAALVDARQPLPGANAVAGLDCQFEHIATDLGRDGALAQRLQRAVEHEAGTIRCRLQHRGGHRLGVHANARPRASAVARQIRC